MPQLVSFRDAIDIDLGLLLTVLVVESRVLSTASSSVICLNIRFYFFVLSHLLLIVDLLSSTFSLL